MNNQKLYKKAKIIYFGNKLLRAKCDKVLVFHKKLHEKIDIMSNTLKATPGSAALAAPQISILKRIIVINYLDNYFELLNPEIIEMKGSIEDYEGCLSLPDFIGKVKRFEKIKVKYQDRFGLFHDIEVEGQLARCFQHEIDHLDGILYVDRMEDKYVINPDNKESILVKDLLMMTDD